MNPLSPPYALTTRRHKAIAETRCNAVYCKTNKRRLVVGRPYVTTHGGIIVLDSVVGPVRVSVPAWLLGRTRNNGVAFFTYRPRNGAPVRFRQRLAGPSPAVIELPWRLR